MKTYTILTAALVAAWFAAVGAQAPARAIVPPPAWAYGIAGPGDAIAEPEVSATEPLRAAGSDRTFLLSQIEEPFGPADWFPDDHPPMPSIVASGRKPAVRACATCHYPNGKGRPSNGSVSGLPVAYFTQAVEEFKNGLRQHADSRKANVNLMVAIAKALTPEETRAAAEYYGSIRWTPWIRVVETDTVPVTGLAGYIRYPREGTKTEPIGMRIIEVPENTLQTEPLRNPRSGFIAYVPRGSVRKGEELATKGGGRTMACGLCHGADLNGAGNVPGIAGRSPSYLARQMYDMLAGTRRGPGAALMKPVVEKLTEEDFVSLSAYVAGLATPAAAAQPPTQAQAQAQTDQGEQKVEQAFKNIQALNGTPAAQLNQAMHLMNAALNVTCEHCHVEGEWDKDVKAPKLVARTMVRMTRDLNDRQFGGAQVITCFTCHQGNTTPVAAPRMPVPEPRAVTATAPPLPAVDDILARYVAALGGAPAIEKVATRVISGTQEIPTGPGGRVLTPATVQRFMKAPDRHVTIYRAANLTITEGFDGTRAWRQDQNGRVTSLPALDARRATRLSGLHAALALRRNYPRLDVRGIERVNGRAAYVVEGHPDGDPPEQWYFDVETGLLLRTRTVIPTSVGDSPQEIAFDDYRDAGTGMKVPFATTLSPAGARTVLFPVATLKVTKVEENVPIDDARFTPPAK